MGLPKTLQINEEGDITNPDECNLFIAGVDPFEIEVGIAMVARYNAYAAREQTFADVAELATELARVLPDYHKSYALVRQIRATLKRAREGV